MVHKKQIIYIIVQFSVVEAETNGYASMFVMQTKAIDRCVAIKIRKCVSLFRVQREPEITGFLG